MAHLDLLQIDGLGRHAASDILIPFLILVLHVVAVCLLDTTQPPFGDAPCAVEKPGVLAAAEGIFHAVAVGYHPIIAGRTAAFANDSAEVASLTGIELAVGNSLHRRVAVCHRQLLPVRHGEHRAVEQVGLCFHGSVIAGNAPTGIHGDGGYGQVPSLPQPTAATVTVVPYAQIW